MDPSTESVAESDDLSQITIGPTQSSGVAESGDSSKTSDIAQFLNEVQSIVAIARKKPTGSAKKRESNEQLDTSTSKKSKRIEPAIDDPHVIESWNRKPKPKFSHINASTLNKIQQDPKKLTAITNNDNKIVKQSKAHSKSNVPKGNHLIDHPVSYFSPNEDFVVASVGGAKNLTQGYYKQLIGNTKLSNHLIAYILDMYAKQYKTKSVQLEIYNSSSLIEKTKRPILKITKQIVLAVHFDDVKEHFRLIIVNTTDSTLAVIDPMYPHDLAWKHLSNFHEFLRKHKAFKEDTCIQLADAELWKAKEFPHQLQKDAVNCGVFVLNFIKQYLKTGKIDRPIETELYRNELLHQILRTSVCMSDRCVKCGSGENVKQKDKLDWVQCDNCDRWTHITCSNSDADFADESIHFFCIICDANASRTDSTDG